jgi:hypothetical protein
MKILLIILLLPFILYYAGFTIGGLIFAIYKEIRDANTER